MTDIPPLQIMLSNETDEGSSWIRADLLLNGVVVASGRAPERPPYIDGTARSSAISLAQSEFDRNVVTKAPVFTAPGFIEKTVRGKS